MNRRKCVDQHDLSVDPGEMAAEERFYNHAFVTVVAAFKRTVQGFGIRSLRWRHGCKCQRRGPFQIAGHKESTGCTIAKSSRSACVEIFGECRSDFLSRWFVQGLFRINTGHKRQPFRRVFRASGLRCQRQSALRPLSVGLIHQWQVQQPFAGIVHDVQMNGARAAQGRQHTRRCDPQ